MNYRELKPADYTAAEVAALLGLEPLPEEGGFFRRTAASAEAVPGGGRAYSVIYFLLTSDGFSAMHRLKADEIWCFQAGDPVESLRLNPAGGGGWVKLGLNPSSAEWPQDVVRAETWQGTRLCAGGRWALVSCVVVPGFRWEDFELGERDALVASHPEFAEGVRALTRTSPPPGHR